MRYMREEGRELAEGVVHELDTRFRDRHALVVARGPGYKHDLRSSGRTSVTSGRCSSASTAARTR